MSHTRVYIKNMHKPEFEDIFHAVGVLARSAGKDMRLGFRDHACYEMRVAMSLTTCAEPVFRELLWRAIGYAYRDEMNRTTYNKQVKECDERLGLEPRE